MLIKTLISGFGGQGVLFIGYCLTTAAMDEDYHTTYLPAYGPEVRGGSANCTVSISDEPIASPVASAPEYVVAMNNPSLTRFQNSVAKGGALLLNSDLVTIAPFRDDVRIVRAPVVTIANELGNPKGMNIVMLGVMIQHTKLLTLAGTERAVRKLFAEKGQHLVEPNVQALRAGFAWKTA
jgi:2-oxoglutarate ferredoxin oxidoreductase subunit gamma